MTSVENYKAFTRQSCLMTSKTVEDSKPKDIKLCSTCSSEIVCHDHLARRKYCSYKCAGIGRSKAIVYESKTCPTCRKEFRRKHWMSKVKFVRQKFCSYSCASSDENCSFWKGGMYKNGMYIENGGYVRVRVAGRHSFIGQHRTVYEEYHKCCILPWILCHHINENKQDNRIENLELMTRKQHSRLHRLGKPAWNKGKPWPLEIRKRLSKAAAMRRKR